MAAAVGTTTVNEHFQSDSAEIQSSDNAIKNPQDGSDKSASPSEPNRLDSNSSDPGAESNDGKKESEDKSQPKVKKFDNKNYVEAPIPKTNPWNKGKSPAAVAVPIPVPVKKAPLSPPVAPVQPPSVLKEGMWLLLLHVLCTYCTSTLCVKTDTCVTLSHVMMKIWH